MDQLLNAGDATSICPSRVKVVDEEDRDETIKHPLQRHWLLLKHYSRPLDRGMRILHKIASWSQFGDIPT
jgi:hypothetical protein